MRRWQGSGLYGFGTQNLNEFPEYMGKFPRIPIESKTSFPSKYLAAGVQGTQTVSNRRYIMTGRYH